jgi:excinuclease ABC subunit A
VVVKVYQLREIDTPAFRAFLKDAVVAFQGTLKKLTTKPEDLMPWKINGERWHLGEKGFPPGKKVHWDRALLPRLLDLVREVEPNVAIKWDAQHGITLRVPGISRGWAMWVTKDAQGLDCRFLGKKGQFNLSRVEPFGTSPTLNGDREDGEVLRLVFTHHEHLHAPKLKELLAEHLRGFREVFGKSKT